MYPPVVTTLLELADATSHNLDFAHRPGVSVSYGEETITETSLLKIARRHPQRKHRVASGKQQRQLLIDAALADGMKPLYCIYSTERERALWTQAVTPDELKRGIIRLA